ncbi:MAG: acetoacetate decarboxylase family protein [Candidatus Binataceae bacterium]
MARQGKLTLTNGGYSMPADASAYQRPPFYYRGARSIAVAYETDADAAVEALPAPLALSEPATAVLSFYEYPWTTFGPYNEAILSLLVEHKGRPLTYIQHIAVTTEPPMLAGREIWGFPKKLASIDFGAERDMIFGRIERPAGIRLASAVVRPERPAKNGHTAPRPGVSYRLIPSPEEHAERPSCAEIIECIVEQRVIEAWTGTGSISFAEQSVLDPWNRLPVKRVLSASYMVYDMTLGHGKIIDRLS